MARSSGTRQNPTPASTREQRRTEGEERNAEWRAKSPSQQLAEIDRRLGLGQGATRQQTKLAGAR